MAMQIYGSYDHSGTDYAERVKEKQAAERAEKEKEAGKEAEAKNAGKPFEPQDEYVSSEKSGKTPTGLYRVEQDENGSRRIVFDDPKKAAREGGKEEPKAGGSNGEKPETCVGNTDAVEREIRELKEKKQELEQEIQAASGDEKKTRELEKKLAQVEQELSQKDNDTYRRQHTVFS